MAVPQATCSASNNTVHRSDVRPRGLASASRPNLMASPWPRPCDTWPRPWPRPRDVWPRPRVSGLVVEAEAEGEKQYVVLCGLLLD